MLNQVFFHASDVATLLSSIADLVSAIALFAWPTTAIVLAVLFRHSIRDLLNRLRKGKVFGQEVELEQSLRRLESQASTLPPLLGAQSETTSEAAEEIATIESDLLQLAKDSPKLALMKLSADIEHAALVLVARVGKLSEAKAGTLVEHLALLERHGLPKSVTATLRQFREVRNRIVHGREASQDDILRAIDSGLLILKGIQSVPHERNIVYRTNVPLFSDPNCKSEIPEGKGVILITTSAGGVLKGFRIFPSTKSFSEGQAVSWDWNGDRRWPESWYRDPDSGECKLAWTGSLEFVGRPLDKL